MNATRFNEFIADFDGEYANEYAVARPAYPIEMIEWIATTTPSRSQAWDAGTGTGDLASLLARRFNTVIASDSNQAMLSQARQGKNIEYFDWPSEEPDLEDDSCDVVTAGMAAHWFKYDKFYRECKRVLKPGGILFVVGFYFFQTDNDAGDIVQQWYHDYMLNYEFPELTNLREHYGNYSIPYERINTPQFYMRENWTFQQLATFLAQWIVVKRAREEGKDELTPVLEQLSQHWGEHDRTEISWPLFVQAARMPS